jgi:hypothetical protein
MGHTGDVDISGFDFQYAIKHTFGGLLVAADSSRKVCVIEATTRMLPRHALQLRNASNAVLLIRKNEYTDHYSCSALCLRRAARTDTT